MQGRYEHSVKDVHPELTDSVCKVTRENPLEIDSYPPAISGL